MDYCEKCGTKNRGTAKFCSRCGNLMEKKQKRGQSYENVPPPTSPIMEINTPPVEIKPADESISYEYENNYFGPPGKNFNPGYDIVPYEYENNYFGPPGSTDRVEYKRKKARAVIQQFAIPAAGLVILPVPFSDVFFLLPIQCAMIVSIGKIYDKQIKPEKVIMEIIAACGFSLLGQITTLVIVNFVPAGRLLSAPMVYGWTLAMGEMAIKYFENNGKLESVEMRNIYSEAQNDYTWNKKMTEEESLENLKTHLTPEEYEKIKKRFKS